jgi:V8-like Glu-specific endopeptidase
MTRALPVTMLLSLVTTACVDDGATTPTEVLPDQVTWRDRTFDRIDRDERLPEAPTTTSLAGKSREELADLLRMTIVHPNGGAYTMQEPNWEAADAALAPDEPIDRTPLDAAESRARRAVDTFDDAIGITGRDLAKNDDAVAVVIGSDGRTLSPHLANPFNAIARVDVFTAGAGGFRRSCTGSWIGPWTFVLAGHCLRFTDGAFARRIVIETARSGSSLPFGRLDCNNADSISSNNFMAAVPAGYNGTLENALDFAVVDVFPCQASGLPASRTFNGYSVGTGTTTYNMHGYPLGRCPSASAEGVFMCGMGDTGYVNDWRLESQLDGTPGQDGAPWFTLDPTRVAGVHVGYREYFDFGRCGFDNCRRQYARRIDGTMDTFIRQNSFDF